MTLKPILIAAGAILATAGAVSAASVTYDGVTFPAGDVSFADAVVSSTQGTNLSSSGACTDTSKALGAPNWVSGDCSEYVSLGNGGSLVLQFTDNALSASGDALARRERTADIARLLGDKFFESQRRRGGRRADIAAGVRPHGPGRAGPGLLRLG